MERLVDDAHDWSTNAWVHFIISRFPEWWVRMCASIFHTKRKQAPPACASFVQPQHCTRVHDTFLHGQCSRLYIHLHQAHKSDLRNMHARSNVSQHKRQIANMGVPTMHPPQMCATRARTKTGGKKVPPSQHPHSRRHLFNQRLCRFRAAVLV